MLNMYGISFNPPGHLVDGDSVDPSFGMAFSANGYGNEVFVMVDRPDLRFKGLAEGEFKIGNYVEGSYVYFKADGSIEIKPKSGQLVNVIGSVTVTGDVTANNFVSTGLPGVDFNTHIHTGDSGGDTGVPK